MLSDDEWVKRTQALIKDDDKMNWKSHTLYQRTLFALIHKVGKNVIKKHLHMLDI